MALHSSGVNQALIINYQRDIAREMKPHERDFVNLVNELVARTLDEELFTFVLDPGVDPTNNLAERLQRGTAPCPADRLAPEMN